MLGGRKLMSNLTPEQVFVYRYRYYPSDEQRDKTRLREIELILEAIRCYERVNNVKP